MQATSLVENGTLVLDEPPVGSSPASPTLARTMAQRGQMLVVFVMAIFVIVGLVGVVIDISWYWTNTLRVQRAADAAALAGAVQLPSRPNTARDDAQSQAGKNGYPSLPMGCSGENPTGVPGMCAHQDTTNRNQMNVSISAPVGTFFMRVFGINSITATRSSKALYTLPVPMGSPENYYGVFGDVRNATMTTQKMVVDPPGSWTFVISTAQAAGPAVATTSPAGTPWTTTPSGTLVAAVESNESAPATIYYARSNTNTATQQWGGFGFLPSVIPADVAMPSPTNEGDQSKATNILGLQVQLDDAYITASCGSNKNSTIGVALSWNGGSSWSTIVNTATLPASTPYLASLLGNNNNTTPWGGHPWVRSDFSDANFRVRLTANKNSKCAAATYLQVDQVQVTPYYTVKTTTATASPVISTTTATYPLTGPGSTCANGVTDCFKATPVGGGQTLNPRGFWATMNTQGAANVNGDAYQPYYDNATSTPAKTCPSQGNACYDPVNYYNYAVKMPAGTSGGRIFIYDPVFCSTALSSGTADRWFSGSNPVSTWYEVYTDPNNTPYDVTDDNLYTSSGSTFQNMDADDSTMGGTNGVDECRQRDDMAYGDARDYHNSWYLLASGLAGGVTYRVHTTSTGPVDQKSANGEQTFAIFADNIEGRSVSSKLPQVYGLGSMQMFTPLKSTGGTTYSEFYLAQVPEFYAGKILEINLWDPGDTNPLAATLYIERPTGSGWTNTEFTYAAQAGTTSGANTACNSNSNSSPTNQSVLTNVGATTGNFNGCWLTLTIPIPTNYSGDQDGWWKIKYAMTGNGTSSDVTTWTAAIKGNPVHLVVP